MMRSYSQLIKRLQVVAEASSIAMEALGEFTAGGHNYTLVLMHLGTPGPGKKSVAISAGIHGDEPAGVEAVIQFLEANAYNEALLSRFHFTIFPCDNPSGWELGIRENADGIDLNREFDAPSPAAEVKIIKNALQGRCFDLVIELHEDIDSPGFYLYELAEQPELRVGESIVEVVASAGYPINDNSIIEGLGAEGGIIRPAETRELPRTSLPKAVYTYLTCGGHVITLEPPASVLPLEDRVKIGFIGLNVALDKAAQDKA